MDAKKVKKCEYNPRSMGRKSRQALKASIDEFDDIAGITINSRDNTLICGNHRFEELCKKYGRDSLSFEPVKGEFHAINSNGKFTKYMARIVDWPEDKVRSANITANNSLITGEYTSGLQEVLSSITDKSKFDSLRLSELQIDLCIDTSLSIDLDGEREHAEKANQMLDEADGFDAEPVKEVISLIKVSVPEYIRDTVKNDLLEFLAKKEYYNNINIV